MQIIRNKDDCFEKHWRTLWDDSQYKYPLHTPLWGKFYKQQLSNASVQDFSFIILKNDQPLFLMLASKLNDGKIPTVSWYGYPVVTIEKNQLTKKEKTFILNFLKSEISSDYDSCNFTLNYLDLLAKNQLSLMTEYLIKNNFKKYIIFTQMIDLKATESELAAGLRKSYKGEIKWGRNNLSIDTITADNLATDSIELFRNLHISAAGRETRPIATWETMQEMVVKREAFCIFGYYLKQLVSAAFFSLSETVCIYGVAASNRDMWDKPLGHALIWEAMIFAKKQGCEWFEMGEIKIAPNIVESDKQQEKELNISKFKAGFGGEKFIRIGMNNQSS
jgi:hypothetical protein